MPFGIAMWQFTSQAITCEYGLLAVTVTVFLSALSVQIATSAANAGPAATNAATAKSQIFMKTVPLGTDALCRGVGVTGSKLVSSLRKQGRIATVGCC